MKVLFSLYFILIGATIAASVKYTQINKRADASPYLTSEVSDDARARSLRKKRQENDPFNTTLIQDVNHTYYKSTYYPNGEHLYVDLDEDPVHDFIPHEQLSEAHLSADKKKLPFIFRFYGHEIDEILMATGGFIYMSSYFHQYLTLTQYIAPLMGNFNPALNDSSIIRYGHNGTAYTVEWSQVHVDHLENAGSFTFQTTLMNDGRIIFAYKNIPLSPSEITGGNGHKVTVGLSDAYYYDVPIFEGSHYVTRTINKYDTVMLNDSLVKTSSAFILTPFSTCTEQTTMCDCFSDKVDPSFDCKWCEEIETCSSGFDRNRQEWKDSDCENIGISESNDCGKSGKGGLIAVIVIIVLLVIIIVAVIVFAITHPLTTVGRVLTEMKMSICTKKSPKEDKYNITEDDAVAQAHADAQNNPTDIQPHLKPQFPPNGTNPHQGVVTTNTIYNIPANGNMYNNSPSDIQPQLKAQFSQGAPTGTHAHQGAVVITNPNNMAPYENKHDLDTVDIQPHLSTGDPSATEADQGTVAIGNESNPDQGMVMINNQTDISHA